MILFALGMFTGAGIGVATLLLCQGSVDHEAI